jgi:hypothetical protein
MPKYGVDLQGFALGILEKTRSLTLTATNEARYRRPNRIAKMTTKITALTGVWVIPQTLERSFLSGSAFCRMDSQ